MRKFIHSFIVIFRFKFKKNYPFELDLIKKMVINGDGVIIDIGAHLGAWSFPLSMHFDKKVIYAFEAFTYYSKVLNIARRIMRIKNLFIGNYAISNINGITYIQYKDSKNKLLTGLNHIVFTADEKRTNEVRMILIDDFFNKDTRKIDFIKCDIEGFELFAFKGALNILKKDKPIVFTEVNYKWCKRYHYRTHDVFNLFEELNYLAYIIDNNKLRKIEKSDYEEFCGDVIFSPFKVQL